jgi:hypothetical protein
VHTNLRRGASSCPGCSPPPRRGRSRRADSSSRPRRRISSSTAVTGRPSTSMKSSARCGKCSASSGRSCPAPPSTTATGRRKVAADLGEYATGVTLGSLRQIHTVRRECHLHEIVHLVAAQLGDPGPFFQEGLAVALSGSKWRGQALSGHRLPASLRRQKISTLAARFETLPPEVAYPAAGSFVVLPDQVVRRVPRRGVLSRLRPLRSAEGRGLPGDVRGGPRSGRCGLGRGPQPQAGIAATTAVVLCQPSRRPLKRAISP